MIVYVHVMYMYMHNKAHTTYDTLFHSLGCKQNRMAAWFWVSSLQSWDEFRRQLRNKARTIVADAAAVWPCSDWLSAREWWSCVAVAPRSASRCLKQVLVATWCRRCWFRGCSSFWCRSVAAAGVQATNTAELCLEHYCFSCDTTKLKLRQPFKTLHVV